MTMHHFAEFTGTRRQQRGIALLEVLIAFFVLSIGLLGLAGMQIKAVQFNQASYQRSQAMALSYDMLDRMRLNRSSVAASYNTGGWLSTFSAGGLAATDKSQWLAAISGNLPGGQGSIDCNAARICTVSVRWINRFEDPADVTDDFEIFSLTSEL